MPLTLAHNTMREKSRAKVRGSGETRQNTDGKRHKDPENTQTERNKGKSKSEWGGSFSVPIFRSINHEK